MGPWSHYYYGSIIGHQDNMPTTHWDLSKKGRHSEDMHLLDESWMDRHTNWGNYRSVGHLDIKMQPSYQNRNFHMKIRQSHAHLIFMMGIPILGKNYFYNIGMGHYWLQINRLPLWCFVNVGIWNICIQGCGKLGVNLGFCDTGIETNYNYDAIRPRACKWKNMFII